MTKRISVLAAAILLAACSSTTSNDGDGGTSGGGGGTSDAGTSGDGGTGTDAGTGVTGSASVSGTIGTTTIDAKDATTVVSPTNAFQRDVLISEQRGECADLQAGVLRKDTKGVAVTLSNTDNTGTSQALATGTYTVAAATGTGMTAIVSVVSTDGTCAPGILTTADSGTVTLTGVDLGPSGSITGSFDVMFGTDHVTGTFDAPACDVTGAPTQTTCQ